ncbi:MAG: hypothetical protein WEB57_09960 [Pseudohongiellaceae bacterium]
MAEATPNKERPPFSKWLEFIAPGLNRVKEFAIPVKLTPQKDGIQVDWAAFRENPKVRAQLEALGRLDLEAGPEKQKPSDSK